jgi:hypothetical protein
MGTDLTVYRRTDNRHKAEETEARPTVVVQGEGGTVLVVKVKVRSNDELFALERCCQLMSVAFRKKHDISCSKPRHGDERRFQHHHSCRNSARLVADC